MPEIKPYGQKIYTGTISLSVLLYDAIQFNRTTEGYDYWFDVYRRLRELEHNDYLDVNPIQPLDRDYLEEVILNKDSFLKLLSEFVPPNNFLWKLTFEGYAYWSDVHARLRKYALPPHEASVQEAKVKFLMLMADC